jgi:hypothetical protein
MPDPAPEDAPQLSQLLPPPAVSCRRAVQVRANVVVFAGVVPARLMWSVVRLLVGNSSHRCESLYAFWSKGASRLQPVI